VLDRSSLVARPDPVTLFAFGLACSWPTLILVKNEAGIVTRRLSATKNRYRSVPSHHRANSPRGINDEFRLRVRGAGETRIQDQQRSRSANDGHPRRIRAGQSLRTKPAQSHLN